MENRCFSPDVLAVEPEYCPKAAVDWYLCKNSLNKEDLKVKARKHLSAMGWVFWYRRKGERFQLRYTSPCGRCFYSLRTACKACIDRENYFESGVGSNSVPQIESVAPCSVPETEASVSGSSSVWETADRNLKPMESINVNDEVRGDSASHRGKNGLAPLKEGYLTRDGVECGCCHKLFTLTGFEAHANSSNHRPAANIILEDGRSLQDCQRQAMSSDQSKTLTRKLQENDDFCTVCHYGGELVLCDRCPSSFHRWCLGLKDVPAGDWFCPSCVCRICGRSDLQVNKSNSMDYHFITCKQCEQKFHGGCRRNEEEASQDREFCGRKCEHIFLGLGRLLGKPIPVGGESLTWTLLKCGTSPESCSLDSDDMKASTENDSKLKAALKVMHNCFEPVKDPHTNRDLVEEVIFSPGSELNQSRYSGFYTVLLERNSEVISVAIIKIHGEKVAEVPLVCTSFNYRRCGMCGILMDELEKQLMALGVERLVLPAAPTALQTWTTSFGFSKMTNSERLQFLEYTFLDFQDTIMCQKLLRKKPAAEVVVDEGPVESAVSDAKVKPKCLDEEATFPKASGSNNCEYPKYFPWRNSLIRRRQSNYDSTCKFNIPDTSKTAILPTRHLGSLSWWATRQNLLPLCFAISPFRELQGTGKNDKHLPQLSGFSLARVTKIKSKLWADYVVLMVNLLGSNGKLAERPLCLFVFFFLSLKVESVFTGVISFPISLLIFPWWLRNRHTILYYEEGNFQYLKKTHTNILSRQN